MNGIKQKLSTNFAQIYAAKNIQKRNGAKVADKVYGVFV